MYFGELMTFSVFSKRTADVELSQVKLLSNDRRDIEHQNLPAE